MARESGRAKAPARIDLDSRLVVHEGDCRELLSRLPDRLVKLVVTSPPYNLGKPYETRVDLGRHVEEQGEVIRECRRVLRDDGSICWQVGNYVRNGEIVPLDVALHPVFAELGMHMRNRIVWRFGHGLHASRRFSGRYEVVSWYTKTDRYTFDLDAVRVPQKYPGKKYFKGPKRGELSCNPLGKNPGDVWEIPNVKSNHVEKTEHPCQFPVELVERLVLSMTAPGDWVLDPFMGVGSALIAALMHGRRAMGAEIVPRYVEVARERLRAAGRGELRVRPREREVYDPAAPGRSVAPRSVCIDSGAGRG